MATTEVTSYKGFLIKLDLENAHFFSPASQLTGKSFQKLSEMKAYIDLWIATHMKPARMVIGLYKYRKVNIYPLPQNQVLVVDVEGKPVGEQLIKRIPRNSIDLLAYTNENIKKIEMVKKLSDERDLLTEAITKIRKTFEPLNIKEAGTN